MADFKESSGSFVGLDNTRIYYNCWKVEQPRGIVVIAHGLGEHFGRYGNLLTSMEADDVSFYALDHRGHGRSEGKRGHINTFAEYTGDLKTFMKKIKAENPGLPVILLGHSMGGTIACKYAQDYPDDIDGLILSSAGLIPAFKVPAWKTGMANLLANIMPGLSMSNGLDRSALSHDQTVVEAYGNDPLVHDRVSARWFVEFSRAGEECLRRAKELTMPLLIIHGAGDKIVDPQGSKQVMAQASSADKQLYIFEGLYHETMNELPPDREKVLNTLRDWIIKQVKSK